MESCYTYNISRDNVVEAYFCGNQIRKIVVVESYCYSFQISGISVVIAHYSVFHIKS